MVGWQEEHVLEKPALLIPRGRCPKQVNEDSRGNWLSRFNWKNGQYTEEDSRGNWLSRFTWKNGQYTVATNNVVKYIASY